MRYVHSTRFSPRKAGTYKSDSFDIYNESSIKQTRAQKNLRPCFSISELLIHYFIHLIYICHRICNAFKKLIRSDILFFILNNYFLKHIKTPPLRTARFSFNQTKLISLSELPSRIRQHIFPAEYRLSYRKGTR